MKLASLCGDGLVDNIIFDVSNPANRDNCFAPYALLQKMFAQHGIQLNTADKNLGQTVLFELHQDVRHKANSTVPAYLLLLETPLIKPDNGKSELWKKYRKVFTWNDEIPATGRFVRLYYPNPIVIPAIDGWAKRTQFCCLIAGNKTTTVPDARELYTERVRAIRWFEKNAPDKFDLYGMHWDVPRMRRGVFNKILRRLWQYIPRSWTWLRPFPSYRGKVDHKRNILLKTRFCICYENARDMPGYITEKIFDAFFAGCVPVYWGANNIADHIPAGCFIDRRTFASYDELYHFLASMNEAYYVQYQKEIAAFLASDRAKKFSSEFFAETIVQTIVSDLAVAI
jgi:hypothetical protein